jgi:toxin HigB-1
MHITFKNAQMKTMCNDFRKLMKKHGERRAKLVMQRLQQFQAMSSLAVARTLPQLGCHELTGDRNGCLAVNLDHPYRLVFTVDQEPFPAKEDGGLDWTRAHTIQIIEIEDYHGKRKKQ